MTPKLRNHIYGAVCLVAAVYAAIPQGALEVIPAKWKEYIVGAAMAAMWIKSHWNLFVPPDTVNQK